MTNADMVRAIQRAATKLVTLTERPKFDDVMWWSALAHECDAVASTFYEGMVGSPLLPAQRPADSHPEDATP
jgi:hypothetical protein